MPNTHTNTNNTLNNDIPLLTAPFLHYIPTSPPSQELDFHLPSRTPLHGITVSEWAGTKHKYKQNFTADDNWKDVYRNIKCMDQLYDASFYSWLKSEENVLVTAMYLHRIANEYPLPRIINALKWLISDWRLESISTLVRHVTVDWCDEVGDLRRAHLLSNLTHSWATQYTTTLITMVLSSAPYTSTSSHQRERFLRAFTKEWDFSKLSEFFMYLQSPANIDYKVKCVMLQEAARRESMGTKIRKKKNKRSEGESTLGDASDSAGIIDLLVSSSSSSTSTSSSVPPIVSPELVPTTIVSNMIVSSTADTNNRRHHRRTSSNDVNDIKRLRLSTSDLDHADSLIENGTNYTSSTSSTTSTRRSASPDHHHHHLRCITTTTSPSTLRITNNTSTTTINVSNELSHLHLGINTTTPSPPSTSTATTSTQFCYPYNSNASLQVHNIHIRRRSSSSTSTDSNTTCDLMNEDSMDNELNKKRGSSSVNLSQLTDETT